MLLTVRLLSPFYYTSTVFHFIASHYFANIITSPFIFGFQYQPFKRALRRVINGCRKSVTLLYQHAGTPTSTYAASRLGIQNNMACSDDIILQANGGATGEMIRLININKSPVV